MRVVRFDNRDVGRSTHVPGSGVSALGFLRRRAIATYSLADMAEDTAGLIEQVAPDDAHVVGVSLGSLIARRSRSGTAPVPGPSSRSWADRGMVLPGRSPSE